MKQVIFNADDFGRSRSINQAVIRAHVEGLLTSTSLMITGEAAEEAVALAKAHPALAVGLHLVVADGRAALPPVELPHLVDERGYFPRDPTTMGIRYFLSSEAKRELAVELQAQFKAFKATELPLSHVDGHQHLHVHPSVFGPALSLAAQYGARGFRLPRDDFGLSISLERDRLFTKAFWALSFSFLCHNGVRRISDSGLACTARVYGLLQTGRMHEGHVASLLERMKVNTAEFYFHPDTAQQEDGYGPNPGDLAALLSPRVRQVMKRQGIGLTTYPGLLGKRSSAR